MPLGGEIARPPRGGGRRVEIQNKQPLRLTVFQVLEVDESDDCDWVVALLLLHLGIKALVLLLPLLLPLGGFRRGGRIGTLGAPRKRM